MLSVVLLMDVLEDDRDRAEDNACDRPYDPCDVPVVRKEAPKEISCGDDHPENGCYRLECLVRLLGPAVAFFLEELGETVLDDAGIDDKAYSDRNKDEHDSGKAHKEGFVLLIDRSSGNKGDDSEKDGNRSECDRIDKALSVFVAS